MTFSNPSARPWRHAIAGLALCMALAGCGGGTSQYEPFVPERLFAFGDETSALSAGGQKYSINGFRQQDDGGTLVDVPDCNALPTWVQSMASAYGFVFAECNPANTDDIRAKTYAAAGAQVEDLKAQVDAQIANGGFRDKDLVTVLAGANDIIALYQQFPGRTEDDLTNELRGRGQRLAEQVNRLISLGAKVIVSTTPDMGLTPYARKQRDEFAGNGPDRAALLSRLSTAFNEQLGVSILLDGRFVGLVQADLRTQAMVRAPAAFNLSNVTDAACLDTVATIDCTAATLATGANPSAWMWADDLRLSFAGQTQIALLALDRARRNPF